MLRVSIFDVYLYKLNNQLKPKDMLVFKVSEVLPDNREFYSVRTFDDDYTKVVRNDSDINRFAKCKSKDYRSIQFKTNNGLINVVAGDDTAQLFFDSFVTNEERLREYIGKSIKYSECNERKDEKINRLESEIKNINQLLCNYAEYKKKTESSIYYKIGKFLRLI